jgi:hypothetical protein
MNEQSTIFVGKHYSYPLPFTTHGCEYILPEVASHSPPYFVRTDALDRQFSILGLEHMRILDATFFEVSNTYYLFFCIKGDSDSALHLWYSDEVQGVYRPHPYSPICCTPTGSRMGGRILSRDGKLYRFGQSNAERYGESLTIFEIKEISKSSYFEKACGSVKVDKGYGPHTLDIAKDGTTLLFDYYREQFSFLAGFRRILAVLRKS